MGRQTTESAASAVQRALLQCVGPAAAEALALAQARLAWLEVVGDAGLATEGMWSRLAGFDNGTGRVIASEPILAAELTLRGPSLARAVNERQRGRPGAVYQLRGIEVAVRPGAEPPP